MELLTTKKQSKIMAKSVLNNQLSVVNWGNGKAYFLKGTQYIRYDIAADKADAGYPLPIKNNWPGLDAFADVFLDAAVEWGNGKAYFFKGNQYIRYDIAADKADAGYPLPIKNNWPGLDAFADGVDAAVNWGNGKAYLFKGNQYIRYDIAVDKADAIYPLPIKNNWPGLDAFADGVDAAVNWGNGKAYLFKGNQYIRYNVAAGKADVGYPLPIKNYWPGLDAFADGVDAAVNWGNGKAYLFKGNQYIRYDIAADKADVGYPLPIKNYWSGLDAFADVFLDAAVEWGNGKVYLFKGNQYIRYDIAADKADAGYPLLIKNNWSGLDAFADGVDAAVNWGNGKIYLFKGNQYIRYDIFADKADAGYPLPIKNNWSGLDAFADGVDAAVNWGNGKAYFFKGDQYIRYDIAADKADAGYPLPIIGNWPGLTF
jgi:hypothetical protein